MSAVSRSSGIARCEMNSGADRCAPRVAAPSQVACAMSKGAIDVLTKTLAVQLGPRGITVNAVAAGATETEGMTALFRWQSAGAGPASVP